MDDDGINPIEKFSGTKTEITLKNHNTWGCPFYILNEILKGNISGLPKWEHRSCEEIYLVHSPFNTVSVALVLNLATSNVLPQFHVVSDDEFYTIPSMREGTIPQN